MSTIDKIVYGLNDGSIVIWPAIEFLVKRLFRRTNNAEKPSKKNNLKLSFFKKRILKIKSLK